MLYPCKTKVLSQRLIKLQHEGNYILLETFCIHLTKRASKKKESFFLKL